jgi:hypothetical protein
LKRTQLLVIAAVAAAVLMPLAAICQVDLETQESESAKPEKPAPTYKYEAYVGYGYSSINQVNQARHGLQGVDAALTRDWGRHFGLTAEGAFYKWPISNSGGGNPGNPSVFSILGGPEYHLQIWGPITGYAHALLGFEHTAGEAMNPNSSFAGGGGGGAEWTLGQHLAIRAQGDDIAASFSLINAQPGYSAHRTRSSRATFGVVYRF